MLRAKELFGLVLVVFFFFYMRVAMALSEIRLISGSSTSVILSNVIKLVCQGFINPQRFLHKVSQPSGVFNDFSFNAVLLCRTKLK